MRQTFVLLLLPVAMAAIHRLRGGGFVTLPVKGTYVLWPLVGLLAWLAGASWPVAVAWACGYFIWILRAWMAFVDAETGAPVPDDQVMAGGPDVRFIWDASFGHPFLACIIRAAFFLLPLVYALVCLTGPWSAAPLALIVPVFPVAYLIGLRLRPLDMSSIAEPIVGLSWGLAMAGSILLGR